VAVRRDEAGRQLCDTGRISTPVCGCGCNALRQKTQDEVFDKEDARRRFQVLEDRMNIGDIVQVNPDKEMFGACLVVVTEVKSWGIQGYVQNAGVNGQAYIRLKTEDFEYTGGTAVWIAGGGE
jgi:hypothetical protein